MSDPLPLPAQLSAAFVAFVIEADNAAEQRLPHITSTSRESGQPGAVWLTSLSLWFTCIGPLADAGGTLTAAQLSARARTTTNLEGMRRWGDLTIDGVGRVPRGPSAATAPRATARSVLALTEDGQAADAVWRPVPGEIEQRWRDRFGAGLIDRLRAALLTIARLDTAALPDVLSIFRPHRRDVLTEPEPRGPGTADADERLPLVSLLSRVLMRFTLDCDRDAEVSLPVWSNLVRKLDPVEPVAVRDLPVRTGVSSEALAMLTRPLVKQSIVVVEPAGGTARGRQLRLTHDVGVGAREDGARRIAAATAAWEETFGADVIADLRAALGSLAGDGTRHGSPLFEGLDPAAGGWRARVPAPRLLPWYPLVLHRGGYPDGS